MVSKTIKFQCFDDEGNNAPIYNNGILINPDKNGVCVITEEIEPEGEQNEKKISRRCTIS